MAKYVLGLKENGKYYVTEGFYHDRPMKKVEITTEAYLTVSSCSMFPSHFFSFSNFVDYRDKIVILEVKAKVSFEKSDNPNYYKVQVKMIREIDNPIEIGVRRELPLTYFVNFINFNMVNSEKEYAYLLPKLVEHKKGPIYGDSIYLLDHNRDLFLRLTKERLDVALVIYNSSCGRNEKNVKWLLDRIDEDTFGYLMNKTYYYELLFNLKPSRLTESFFNKFIKADFDSLMHTTTKQEEDGYYEYPRANAEMVFDFLNSGADLSYIDFDGLFEEKSKQFHYCWKEVDYTPKEIDDPNGYDDYDYYDDYAYGYDDDEDGEDYEDEEEYEEPHYFEDEREYELGASRHYLKHLTVKSLPILSLMDEDLLDNVSHELKDLLKLEV